MCYSKDILFKLYYLTFKKSLRPWKKQHLFKHNFSQEFNCGNHFVKNVLFRNGSHFKIDPPYPFLQHSILFWQHSRSFFGSTLSFFFIELYLFPEHSILLMEHPIFFAQHFNFFSSILYFLQSTLSFFFQHPIFFKQNSTCFSSTLFFMQHSIFFSQQLYKKYSIFKSYMDVLFSNQGIK